MFRDLGWTVSVVLKSGRLSDLIAQLQVLLRGVDEAEISSDKYDSAALTAQVALPLTCLLYDEGCFNC